MKISFNAYNLPPKTYSPYAQSNSPARNGGVNFTSQPHTSSAGKVKPSIGKRLLPFGLTGLLTLFGINSCSDKGYTGRETIDNVKVEYFNAGREAKDSTLTPIFELKSKLTPENDFLDGLEISISDRYSHLDESNSFSKYLKADNNIRTKGCSFYSDGNLTRRIAIQEKAHSKDKVFNYFKSSNYTAVPFLRQTAMHEAGHQFDNYFGHDHSAEFARAYDSVMLAAEKNDTLTPYDMPKDINGQKTVILYNKYSGLNDSREFQEAMFKDIQKIQSLRVATPEKLSENLHYYVSNFNLSNPITFHDVELAEFSRAEVYANLFSYAMGQDDGDRANFIDNFSNCYKVVKRDIKKHLNIDSDSLTRGMKSVKRMF